jgi:N-formylglutamate amidohydrolase
MKTPPEWLIFHVPHDSKVIPETVRAQFALDESDLANELLKMTDHLTCELFTSGVPESQVVRAPVSRLVVDVERFEDDRMETMVSCGMGVVYTQTHDGRALRHPLNVSERRSLIDAWYRPHHASLTSAAERALSRFGRCLVLDAHSFPSSPLPYEMDQQPDRPEICLGTNEVHTPKALESVLVNAFRDRGFTVKINSPFSGALVPQLYFKKDRRVSAAMVEVRRDLYLDESTGERARTFTQVAEKIRSCLAIAMHVWATFTG